MSTSESKLALSTFAAENGFCWMCGISRCAFPVTPVIDYPRRLEVHHIIRGSGRVHDRRNLARLCKLCHDLHHGHTIRDMDGKPLPNLLLSHILFAKHRHDGPVDRKYLRTLRPKILPPMRRTPIWFLKQYYKWHVNYPGDG